MSDSSSAFASTSTDLRSGCGALATGADDSRLSENDFRTARSSGEPARATKVMLRASSWILPPALRNSATYSPPVPYQSRLPISPANSIRSPIPRLMLIDRKNGLSSMSAGISIQALSSFCQIGNRPWMTFASFTTSANGRGAPGGVAAAGAAAPAAGFAASGAGVALGLSAAAAVAAAADGSGLAAFPGLQRGAGRHHDSTQ